MNSLNMSKKMFLIAGLLTASGFCMAQQEVWLKPDKYTYQNGETMLVNFETGELFIGKLWNVSSNQIARVDLHNALGSSNLLDSIKPGKKENLSIALKSGGTHMLAFQSENMLIEFAADSFNVILQAYELDDVRSQRTKSNALSTPARVHNRLFLKLLFQVTEKKDNTFRKVLDWPVEIIPDRNPYSLKLGDQIRFKILFDGKPAFGVRVKIWNRFDNRTTIQNIYTEQDGTFEARISSRGPWMVTVMKMIPSSQASADWQGFQGGLMFGIN